MTRDTNNADNRVRRPENREWIVATESGATLVGYDYIVQNLNSPALAIIMHHIYKTGQNYFELIDVQQLVFEGEAVLEIQWSE